MKKQILREQYHIGNLDESPLEDAAYNAAYNVVCEINELFGLKLNPKDSETRAAAEMLAARLEDGFDAAGGLYDPFDLPEVPLEQVEWKVEYTGTVTGRHCEAYVMGADEVEALTNFCEIYRHGEYSVQAISRAY